MILIIYGRKIKFLPLLVAGLYLSLFSEFPPGLNRILELSFYSPRYQPGKLISCGKDSKNNRVFLLQTEKYGPQLERTLKGLARVYRFKEGLCFYSPDFMNNQWLELARIAHEAYLPASLCNYCLQRGLKNIWVALNRDINIIRGD